MATKDTYATEGMDTEEILATLRKKQAELISLQRQVEDERIARWDMSGIPFNRAKGVGMWAPVVLASWAWGFLSNFDCAVGMLCLLAACFFAVFVECYSFVRVKINGELAAADAAAAAATATKPQATPRSAKKRPVEQPEGKEREAVWDPGQITIKTWLPPFLVLWFFRHNFTDMEMILAVLALIGALKLGQVLVRRFEKTRWRQALRDKAKLAASKQAKQEAKEAKRK